MSRYETKTISDLIDKGFVTNRVDTEKSKKQLRQERRQERPKTDRSRLC